MLKFERYKQRRPEAIVDPKVWNAAQDALAKRRKRKPQAA